MRHNEHLKVVKFRPIICDTFLQIFISAMFVMGIAESLTVDRKTREIALLCKNRTIKNCGHGFNQFLNSYFVASGSSN